MTLGKAEGYVVRDTFLALSLFCAAHNNIHIRDTSAELQSFLGLSDDLLCVDRSMLSPYSGLATVVGYASYCVKTQQPESALGRSFLVPPRTT